jgi:RNA recognition motif-containing protein
MSIFIGNISRSVTEADLEKSFSEYGSCKINYKGSYAFAEFDAEKSAEDALDHLQGKNFGGRPINLEWSKKSRKYDPSKSKRRRRSISPRTSEGRCYNCGSRNHYLKDCRY